MTLHTTLPYLRNESINTQNILFLISLSCRYTIWFSFIPLLAQCSSATGAVCFCLRGGLSSARISFVIIYKYVIPRCSKQNTHTRISVTSQKRCVYGKSPLPYTHAHASRSQIPIKCRSILISVQLSAGKALHPSFRRCARPTRSILIVCVCVCAFTFGE